MRPGSRRFLSILLVFALAWLSARLLLPLFGPFLIGTFLALAAEPMVSFLHRKLRFPRGAASALSVTVAFGFLMLILLLLCAFLVRELSALSGVLPQLEEAARSGIRLTQNRLLELIARTPRSIRPLLEENITSFFSDGSVLLSRGTALLLGLAGNLLSHIPDSALGFFTAVLSGYMISAKLPRIRRFLLRRIPRHRLQALADTWKRIRGALGSWLKAQGKLIGLTFVILLLGFMMLRIPYALFWALGVCLVDVFPILGTGTVLIPWSIVLFLQNDTPRAVGILGIYATVTLSRSILEPKLLGRHLGLDPLATLIALYAGYRLWGIGGMLLSPILAATALQLVPEQSD